MKVATTVFVGNITEKASDTLIRQILLVSLFIKFEENFLLIMKFIFKCVILQRCGPVEGWKRVQDASGKLQGIVDEVYLCFS